MSPTRASYRGTVKATPPKASLMREVSASTFEELVKGRRNSNSSASSVKVSELFLISEGWAKADWKSVEQSLTAEEVSALDPDFVVRAIRSSSFMPQPERRKRRNLILLRSRVRWQKKYKVDEIMSICEGNCQFKGVRNPITPARVEQFRSLIMPMKLFGVNKDRIPLVKFSLKETKWKEASKLFRDAAELKYLLILTFQSLLEKLKQLKCRAACADDSTFVTGQFILICDVENLGVKHMKYGYSLQIYRIVNMISKYYPHTVLRTYCINSRHCTRGSKLLYPFVPKHIIKRMGFFSNEKELVESLQTLDGFKVSQIPVEFGGTFEGRYVVDVATD